MKALLYLVASLITVSASGELRNDQEFEVAEMPNFYDTKVKNDQLVHVVQPIHRVPRPMPNPIPIRSIPAENAEPPVETSTLQQPIIRSQPILHQSSTTIVTPPTSPTRPSSEPRSRLNYQRPVLANRPIISPSYLGTKTTTPQVTEHQTVNTPIPAIVPSSESWFRSSYQRPNLTAKSIHRLTSRGSLPTREDISVPTVKPNIAEEKEVTNTASPPTWSRQNYQRPTFVARPMPRPISNGIIPPQSTTPAEARTNPPEVSETSSVDVKSKQMEEFSTSTSLSKGQEQTKINVTPPPPSVVPHVIQSSESWSTSNQMPIFSANPISRPNDIEPQITTESSQPTALSEITQSDPIELVSVSTPESNHEITSPSVPRSSLVIPSSETWSRSNQRHFLSTRPIPRQIPQNVVSPPQQAFESDAKTPVITNNIDSKSATKPELLKQNSDVHILSEKSLNTDLKVTEIPVESNQIMIEPTSTTSTPLSTEHLVVIPKPSAPSLPSKTLASNLGFRKILPAEVAQASRPVGGIRYPTVQVEERIKAVQKPIPSIFKPKPITKTKTSLVSGNIINMECPSKNGYFARQDCDSYIECKKNMAIGYVCPDGLHFNPNAMWPEYPCAYPSEVKCVGNSEQLPNSTADCPRQYGFFSTHGDCSSYISCQDGLATVMNCPPGLVFNPDVSTCDWPEQVPSCKPEVFKGFTCPPAPLDEDGNPWDIIINYRYGNSCKHYIACQRGSPRLLSCDKGNAFDEISGYCVDFDYVRNCSD